MGDIDRVEDHKFKAGQSGNPAGKPKGICGGRVKALGALDRITGKEENIRLIEAALEEALQKKPLWFFMNIVMPLLPKETKGVLEAGDRIVEWRSLVSAAAGAAADTGV